MKNNAWMKTLFVLCAAVLGAAVLLSLSNSFGFARADGFVSGDAEIGSAVRNLEIDWTSGAVHIAYHSGNTVLVSEKADKALREEDRLQWELDGDTLRIRYQKPGIRLFSFNAPRKELTVTLPENTALGNVRIGGTSAALDVPALQADRLTLGSTSGDILASAQARIVVCDLTSGDLTLRLAGAAEEVKLGSTSGSLSLEAESIGKAELGSTSGSISAFLASADSFKAGSTSGSVQAVLGQVKRAEIGSTSGRISVEAGKLETLTVDSTSGNVTAALPAEPGFTARLSTTSGRIEHGLPMTQQGNAYVCGDGSASVKIGTTSGSITVTGTAAK